MSVTRIMRMIPVIYPQNHSLLNQKSYRVARLQLMIPLSYSLSSSSVSSASAISSGDEAVELYEVC